MELLMISFVSAWILRHSWDERRRDYRTPDNAYAQMTGGSSASAPTSSAQSTPPPRRSGPDMRYAFGWSMFQLRHGWPAMISDVKQGWSEAREGYESWRAGNREAPRPRIQDAWKRGWRAAHKKLPKTRRQQNKAEPQPAAGPEQTPEPSPAVIPGRATEVPFGIPKVGESMTAPTGEVSGITAYRTHLEQTIRMATSRIEAAQVTIQNADNEISAHETAHAQLGAAGMGAETTGEVASLVEAAQSRKTAAQQDLAAAEASKANAEKAIADLDGQGHTTVEESVKGATAQVADTSFYQN